MRIVRLLLLVSAALLNGCASLGYYAQAVGGQLDILARTRPISELLDDAPTDPGETLHAPAPLDPATKARLARVLEIRAFATQVLGLPDNGSYRAYADLGRPVVAWNVIATPEFSLEPREWCFPFAGCVPYRGYFARANAARQADDLRSQGLDVRVAPVTAYSTLGWFRDPVLKSQLRHDDRALAAVMFHELAHQALYVPGDAAFNESFATAVEIEGMRRWLAARNDPAALAAWQRERAAQVAFVARVLDTRAQLASLYASAASDADKRAAKARIFAELRAGYAQHHDWDETASYATWFAQDLNNAHLAGIGIYHQHLPAFEALLREAGGDLAGFYRAAGELGRLPRAERDARLAQLAAQSPGEKKEGRRAGATFFTGRSDIRSGGI